VRWPPGVAVVIGSGSSFVQVIRKGGAIHVIERIGSLARCAMSSVGRPGFVDPETECSLVDLKRNVFIVTQSPLPHVHVPLGIFMELLFFGGVVGTAADVFRKPVAVSTVIQRVNAIHVITRFVDIFLRDESSRLGNFFIRVEIVFHNATQVMVAILANGANASIVVFAVAYGESIRPPLDAKLHQLKRHLQTFVGIHGMSCNQIEGSCVGHFVFR